MSDSKRKAIQSDALNALKLIYAKATIKEEKDLIWNSINTPFIENIPMDENNRLVTFLYRKPPTEATVDFSIYLNCDAVGIPFAENNKFKPIQGTDLLYLTLALPRSLRTTYSFLKLDKTVNDTAKKEVAHELFPFPEFIGEFKKYHTTYMRLCDEQKIEMDPRNPKNISYVEFDNPDKCFFTESILELPNAPTQPAYFYEPNAIRNERNKLAEEKRFFQHSIMFSNTSLKNLPEYKDTAEDKDQPSRGTRKFWIYLPPGYNDTTEQSYPLSLFLDGSDYLNTIPIPSILERMIKQKEIPPCVAVFVEYSAERRTLEYYGDDKFTHFLANDLMNILRHEHHLQITSNPSLTTIIGLSASGLAAIYAGLTRPDIFGNIITQSAALCSKKQSELENMVNIHALKNTGTFFCMEAGVFENVPIECRFEDGFTQALSTNESNKRLSNYMREKGVLSTFHEFVGGHNYVCYRGSLPERLKEVYKMRLDMS